MPNILSPLFCFYTILLANVYGLFHSTNATASTITTSSSTISQNQEFFISLLFAVSLSLLIIAIFLYKHFVKLQQKEKALNARYELLSQQTAEKNEKLYNTNNQIYEEIAEHESTEELLIETRNYLQSIINSMPSILIGVNREGIVTHWNTAAQDKTGISYIEALGTPFHEVFDETHIKASSIQSSIDRKKPYRLEAIQEGTGAKANYRDITIYPLTTMELDSAVIRIDDVTSRVQLENMIIQNEKMGSLGELAAGVAHEINNPLGTILQSLQNIQRRLSDELSGNKNTAETLNTDVETINRYLEERKILTFLDSIKSAGERATSIVTNMLEFSGTNTFKHEPVQLIPLINRSLDLAISASSLSQEYDNIQFSIVRELPDACPIIYGSSAELQQVFLNLVNNAYQAYSDHFLNQSIENKSTEEGLLTITVSLNIDKNDVVIEVKDNGPGMDEWTQKHIFEPFFSTKGADKGTGLGLSISYFIISEHHGGEITVNSEINKGTTFTLRLPIKE